jgi:alpha-tubulin suppressor-like RCC1 family protein
MEEVEEAAAGSSHCLALKKDGSLWAWGDNSNEQVGIPKMNDEDYQVPQKIPKFWGESEKIVGIGTGESHSWAVTCSGNLWTWGLGQAPDLNPNRAQEVPHLKNYFSVNIPRSREEAAHWMRIFRWFFLGASDSGSAMSVLPIEVIFNTVLAWSKFY